MNALGFTIGHFKLKRGDFDEQLDKAIKSYKEVVNESKERSRVVRGTRIGRRERYEG